METNVKLSQELIERLKDRMVELANYAADTQPLKDLMLELEDYQLQMQHRYNKRTYENWKSVFTEALDVLQNH